MLNHQTMEKLHALRLTGMAEAYRQQMEDTQTAGLVLGNTRDAAMGRNRDPYSADWKGPHGFLVLRRDVGQGQSAIDGQAFLRRVASQ